MPLSPIPFRHAGIAALLIAITINSVHAAPDADPVLTLAEGHLRLEARLRKMGIGADKPFSMPASIDTARQIKKATQGSERIARPGQAVGLVVRFRSPDVQALSARNAPPPDALVAQLNSVAGGELSYQRAMSMGFHVFRFATPKPLSEAGAILERLRALPEIEQVTEDLRTSRDLTPNDVAFPTQWNMQSVYTYGGAANLPSAWTMITDSEWATMSCSSRAIVARARDSASRACCSRSASNN